MLKFLYTKGIFILTFQNTGITQVVSHKNISIGGILLNLENRFKKKKKKLEVKRMMLFYLIIKHLIYFQHFQVRKNLIKIRPKWDLWSSMDAKNVHLGTGPGNFYLNPFLLSSLLNDLDKRSDHCPCQGYLGVKVHPAIFDDIGDLYALLTQVGFTY